MTDESPLGHLVGAYLNQDLFDLYPDVMAGVDDFAKHEPDLAAALPAEIEAVLASHREPVELNALMTRLGVGFIPGDLGYDGWLTRIADRVREPTHQR